jgi:small-conductance mechanosensitive channel
MGQTSETITLAYHPEGKTISVRSPLIPPMPSLLSPLTLRSRRRWPQELSRWLVASLLGFSLAMGLGAWLSPGAAQLPNLLSPPSGGAPPIGVQRLGALEATAVSLDGTDLFDIASPAVLNRQDPGGQVPVEVRALQVENNLRQVVTRILEADLVEDDTDLAAPPPTIDVIIQSVDGQPVLVATSDRLTESKVLLTVTTADAQYHNTSQAVLAELWQGELAAALQQALDNRLPDALQRQLQRVVWISLASLITTLILTGIWKFLDWRKQALEAQLIEQEAIDLHPLQGSRQILHQHLPYQISLQQQLQVVSLMRWLIFWGVAFVWTTGLSGVLYVFPQTRGYAASLFSIPVLLLVTWFFTGFLNRLANLGIDRIAQAWSKNELGTVDDIQRKSMRISTIIGALKGLKTTVIYALATLWVLQILRIAPASLLAFGALAALAVSFGAQNLVKDLVNGFLILLEDQYAIGDLVTTGTTTGIVENLNLRITQIRGSDGRLVTLPNSLITQVDNLSRSWSRADLTIEVAYGTDIDQALRVMRQVSYTLAADPLWKEDILDPTEMVGVETMTHAGMGIRIWIRTRPLRQFWVAREFRRRLRLAFEQEGIAIGVPQQMFTGLTSNTSHPLKAENGHHATESNYPWGDRRNTPR